MEKEDQFMLSGQENLSDHLFYLFHEGQVRKDQAEMYENLVRFLDHKLGHGTAIYNPRAKCDPPSDFANKVSLRHSSFIYILSMTAFIVRQQS